MVFIVIPVHNRVNYTINCLKSLKDQTFKNFKIIVVDDGSTDKTSQIIAYEFPDVKVLRGNGDLWWTGATNLGIEYALSIAPSNQKNFILTLNNDTLVSNDYLKNLIDTYISINNDLSIIGSISVDSNNSSVLTYAGTKINLYLSGETDYAKELFANRVSNIKKNTKYLNSDSLPGRGTLIPFDVIQKIGLFDHLNYPHYLGDIEFSVRAKKSGIGVYVSTNSIVTEFVDASGLPVQTNISTAKFIRGFFSIRSSTHLKPRLRFALSHTKTKIVYFILDVLRMLTGFAIRKIRNA
ncbi:hypothetical protein GCM10027578_05970 [Spirosoma luteolum]